MQAGAQPELRFFLRLEFAVSVERANTGREQQLVEEKQVATEKSPYMKLVEEERLLYVIPRHLDPTIYTEGEKEHKKE